MKKSLIVLGPMGKNPQENTERERARVQVDTGARRERTMKHKGKKERDCEEKRIKRDRR